MENRILGFNPHPSTIMHLDLNSCFATIEQQANPLLRGKPIAVAAYTTPRGCILAPSIEAKKFGVKTGMRVMDGKVLCPRLIVLPTDPAKYRGVHLKLRKLLESYTPDIVPKSIDEFVLDFGNFSPRKEVPLKVVAQEIKQRIKSEVGDWITVSIGISTNRFLSKLASSLHKPDGLEEINKNNFLKVFLKLALTDLPYIKTQNALRLNSMGIYTVYDFYEAPLWKLKAAFQSINGYYWYLRLKGWEIDGVEFGRKSYGNSYALPKSLVSPEELSPILTKLVVKTGARLRRAGFKARGVHLSILFRDWSFWHKGKSFDRILFDSRDIYGEIYKILISCPYKKPVRQLAVSVFNLLKSNQIQLSIFEDIVKKQKLTEALDKVNEHFGNFVITPARMLDTGNVVCDRIAFGSVRELEELLIGNS